MYFKRIKELRLSNKLTQQQIADTLNCQREVYRRYEVGIREIPVSYAITLSKFYKVSLDYLLNTNE